MLWGIGLLIPSSLILWFWVSCKDNGPSCFVVSGTWPRDGIDGIFSDGDVSTSWILILSPCSYETPTITRHSLQGGYHEPQWADEHPQKIRTCFIFWQWESSTLALGLFFCKMRSTDEIDWWPFRTTFLLSCWIAGTERNHRLESNHYVWRIWMQMLTQRCQWNQALHAVSDAVHSRTYPSFDCGKWTCFCLQANDDIHWGAWHGCTMTMSYKATSLEEIPSLYTEQTSPNKHICTPQNKIQDIKWNTG